MKIGRDLLSALVLVAAIFAIVASFPMTWFESNIQNREGFVAIAELAGYDQKLHDRITDEIVNTVETAIPVPTPVVGYVKPKLRELAGGLYRTDQFHSLWREAMYSAHDKMLTPGGGAVQVNLAPQVKRSISDLRLPFNLEKYVPADINVTLTNISDVPIIRTLSGWTKYIPIEYFGGFILGAGALMFAGHRRFILLWSGLVTLMGALLLWLSTNIGLGLLPKTVTDFPATQYFIDSYVAAMQPVSANTAWVGAAIVALGFILIIIPWPKQAFEQ